jgi:hypothetical protein
MRFGDRRKEGGGWYRPAAATPLPGPARLRETEPLPVTAHGADGAAIANGQFSVRSDANLATFRLVAFLAVRVREPPR